MRDRAWQDTLRAFLSCGALSVSTAAGLAADVMNRGRAGANIQQPGAVLSLSAAKVAATDNLPRFFLGTVVNDLSPDRGSHATTSVIDVGGGRLVAAFHDVPGSGLTRTGYAHSSDNGLTWTDAGRLPESGGGPVLAHDQSSGAVYLAVSASSIVHVFKSTDNGHSFGPPVNGSPGMQQSVDRQSIAVDNFAGLGNGNVYLCWLRQGTKIAFSRSTNQGAGFARAAGGLLTNDGKGCSVVVSPNHQVSVFYHRVTTRCAPTCIGVNTIFMRRSLDRGVTFQDEVEVARLLTASPSESWRHYPRAAVDAAGRLYVIYNDDPTPDHRATKGGVYLVRSNDGGLTWTTPARIDDDGGSAVKIILPSIAFTSGGQEVMASWYSYSHDQSNRLLFSHRRGRLGYQKAGGAIVWHDS